MQFGYSLETGVHRAGQACFAEMLIVFWFFFGAYTLFGLLTMEDIFFMASFFSFFFFRGLDALDFNKRFDPLAHTVQSPILLSGLL